MAISKIKTTSILDATIATADIADGAVTAVKTTGVGGENTPCFHATMSADQTLSDNTATKVTFNTEKFDVGSCYDHSSNYRFTVPSGEAGKYKFAWKCRKSVSRANSQLRTVKLIHLQRICLYANYQLHLK